MAFQIIEGIVRLINSVGTAITSTTDGAKVALDTHVSNTVTVPANVSTVVSGAVVDPRSPAIDTTSTGTITAAGQTVQIVVAGYPSRGIVVTGSWAGSLVCETSSDGGTTWTSSSVTKEGSLALAEEGIIVPLLLNSISSNGTYKPIVSAGITHLRVNAQSFTTGSASISIVNSAASSTFMYGQQSIVQSVVSSAANSSTTNLLAGGSFTGISTSTLGVAGLQVSLYTDQNCTVYVEQSQDTFPHWDISDSYNYYANTNFGITVQAVSTYTRVRVVNLNALTATTYFRLQTVLCPIVEALPRTLDSNGNLQTATKSIEDDYGFKVENTPIGEQRTVIPYRLIGAAFEGTTVDSNYWLVTNTNAGTSTQANAQMVLATNTTPNGATIVTSAHRARYVSGSSMCYRAIAQLSAGVTDNKRRWGIGYGATLPTITDGAYFQLNGSTFSIVTLKGGVETKVDSGSFNGRLGLTYSPGTSVKIYEIYWTNSRVIFVIGGVTLHTVSASSATWASTMMHHIFMDNVNSNSIITNNTLTCRVVSIRRLGAESTQANSKYTTGTQAGVTCKLGPGNLNGFIAHANANNAVLTIYDGTSVAGTILYQTGPIPTASGINSVQFAKSIPFSTGLFYTVTTQSANVMLSFE